MMKFRKNKNPEPNNYACQRLIDAGLEYIKSGKTTEIFKIPGRKDLLLAYATDRVSAFNIVLDFYIEIKGAIVTGATIFWLRDVFTDLENHLIASGQKIFDYLPQILKNERFAEFHTRCLVLRKADILPVKSVVREYLTGEAFKQYEQTGSVCGEILPPGLKKNDKLPEPIFTPSVKTKPGKPNRLISMDELSHILQSEITAKTIRAKSKYAFKVASLYINQRGLTLADTKLKWGTNKKGQLFLVGKVITPDSSRIWKTASQPNKPPEIYGKGFIKNWGRQIDIEKNPHTTPGPVTHTKMRNGYFYAFHAITGRGIQEFDQNFPQ
jgi:phosphoribosylaminoimidazole-succinocarboxamide synthase